jgi:hypothetical protein
LQKVSAETDYTILSQRRKEGKISTFALSLRLCESLIAGGPDRSAIGAAKPQAAFAGYLQTIARLLSPKDGFYE